MRSLTPIGKMQETGEDLTKKSSNDILKQNIYRVSGYGERIDCFNMYSLVGIIVQREKMRPVSCCAYLLKRRHHLVNMKHIICVLLAAVMLLQPMTMTARAAQDPLSSGEKGSAVPMENAGSSAQQATAEQTEFQREMPLYFQTDYPNVRFADGTIATSGCSVTCLAMVATYLTGHTYLPDELADYFGGCAENNIERLELGAQQLQLPIHKAKNVHEVFDALKEGDVAILLMNRKSLFTQSQHFIVIRGLNEDGKIMVNDPYQPNYDLWNLKRAFVEGFEEGDIILGYDGGWIFDVSAMPEAPFIYVEEKPYVEPRYPDVELTWEEQQLLAKLIWLEARGEPAEGQQAVAEVVLNRLVSGKYGKTLSDVIYDEGQFRTVPFLKDAEPWQAQYDAIDDALEGPYILPIDVVHFATYAENENVWGKIGGHYFCYGY